MKKFLIFAAAAVVLIASCKKDSQKQTETENPNPTTFSGLYVVNSDVVVDPDGFNMLTDGGFERFIGNPEWKSKSLFYLPENVSEAETAYNGKRTLFADCNFDGWTDVAVQTFAAKKSSSYTLSVSYRGAWKGLNTYIGFRTPDPVDINTNNPEGNDEWAEYTHTLQNTDATEVTAFIGGWAWYNLWLEVDDMKVIPTGSNNDTFMPANVAIVDANIKNASFTEVKSVTKTISWKDDSGNLQFVLSGAKLAEGPEGDYFASAKGEKITKVEASNMKTADNMVFTSGVNVAGTNYVHYYTNAGKGLVTEENPEPSWIAGESAILSSKDGKTWTKAVSFSKSGNFVKVSFAKKDKYVYAFGSAAGDKAVRTYVARVEAANIADAKKYQYWDGSEWVSGDESAAAPIFYGPTDEMAVFYNADKFTFMAIYHSSTTGGLVYRDSGLAEGEWSGEKILILDDTLYSPQILDVQGGKFSLIASKK